jgi:hypothetical protein
MRLPIRMLGLVAGAFLMGSALAPVAAQQNQSGVDGQVAVRSDGAVYLISNGQRRWVASVVITDEDIDKYPEGEPIYAGLAPMGSAQAAAGQTQPRPTTATSSGASGSGANTAANNSTPQPTATSSENLNDDLPVKVDIEGDERFETGDEFTVQVTTRPDAVCELEAKFPGGEEVSEDSKNADNKGKCRYTVKVPDDADEGDGTVIATVRDGGKVNKAEITFSVVED